MSYVQSSPFLQMDNPALLNLLKTSTTEKRRKPSRSTGIKGLLQMFKLVPLLSSGCKMVTLLGRPRRASLPDRATTVTIFGYRTGKVTLAIQENPNAVPMFVAELPMSTTAFQKEVESDIVRIALESESRKSKKKTGKKKKLMEEMVWAVYCNGRKMGYSIRRNSMSEEEAYVMRSLRGVSMGAGVLPASDAKKEEETTTYLRMRFERGVAESEDSQALYMINPDDDHQQTEFSIYFLTATN